MRHSPTKKEEEAIIAVLNAQSGKEKLEPTRYKEMYQIAQPFLNSIEETGTINQSDGSKISIERRVEVGGMKKEIYKKNKDNKNLCDASDKHLLGCLKSNMAIQSTYSPNRIKAAIEMSSTASLKKLIKKYSDELDKNTQKQLSSLVIEEITKRKVTKELSKDSHLGI